MPNLKPFAYLDLTGVSIGKLTVGGRVLNVQQHPLYNSTPISYIQQGRLRECTCECGKKKLYSEVCLRSGSIKSCGCWKLERKNTNLQKKIDKLNLRQEIANFTSQIQINEIQLEKMRNLPVSARTIDAINSKIHHIKSLKIKRGIAKGKLAGRVPSV